MRRSVKIILGAFLGLLVLLAVCIALLAAFNWNPARPYIGRQLSELANRPVAIQGDLDVRWLRQTDQNGWRRWVPWPEITARQVHVGNPDWINPDAAMGHVERLTLLVNPLALLNNTIQVTRLDIDTANIQLARQDDGASNWTLEKADMNQTEKAPAKWQFDLQQLTLHDVVVQVNDPATQLDLKAELDSLKEASEDGYMIGWEASGRFNQGDISGTGQMGNILSLQEDRDPFPVAADLSVGETRIQLEGGITQPTRLAGLALNLKLAGASMSDLNPLISTALPNTPPYSTAGRLTLLQDEATDTWRYEKFSGKVGESDLNGTLEFLIREPRPLLTGTLESRLLRLRDLGPLVGADTAANEKDNKEPKSKQPPDKAIPVETIDTEIWDNMDADVQFTGQKILRDKDLPLDNVKAHVKLDNRVLSLDPLNFGVAGGTLASTIRLDGQSPHIKASLDIDAKKLQLRKLIPSAESMQASLGAINGQASLTGQGESFAQLLGSSNGELKAVVSKGTISHFLLEAAGLNVANMVLVKLFGDEQIVLNCLAADFDIKNGLMQTRAFKLDTEDATIDVTGTINLATEQLDLLVNPENKSLRIFTLRTPLYVQGTFKNPDVGVQAGPIAAKAAAATALGVIATPFAALIPLLNFGTDDSNECAPLLKAANPDAE